MRDNLSPGLNFGVEWKHQEIKLSGLSLSGIRTAISFPELGFTFDVAQGFPYLLNLKQYFISHGHLDHAAGIPYIISQKAMNRQEPAKFYMPKSLVAPMTKIMQTWEEIEKHKYDLHFIGVDDDVEIPVKGDYFMKGFPANHRIDGLGYTLFHRKKKLKPEFKNESEDKLRELKKRGEEIQEVHESAVLSFSGDTKIEFLDQRPWIKNSKVLMLESTYLDDKKSIEHARNWGHTHLDEIIPRLPELKCEKLVLIHLSSRYSSKEADAILDKKIPKQYRSMIEIFPGR